MTSTTCCRTKTPSSGYDYLTVACLRELLRGAPDEAAVEVFQTDGRFRKLLRHADSVIYHAPEGDTCYFRLTTTID